MSLEIRPVREEDVEVVCDLIHALARYERLESHCKSTPERLREELFGPHAVIGCVLAWERNEATGAERPVGFALYFYNFSTFLTRRGYGRAIIRHLARKALDEGCGRFDWSVLDWNQPAIDFYEGLGAEVMPDWRICRLSGDALQKAAQ